MTQSIDGSGYYDKYGLLGSNKATEDTVKLFPVNGQPVVDRIHDMLKEKTGKNVEVMILRRWCLQRPCRKDLGAGRPCGFSCLYSPVWRALPTR